jgi:PEP-CTERM motif
MTTEKRASTRKSETLPEGANKRLTAYALAAGAAGVGVLALAEPAQADIITVTTPISIPGAVSINDKTVLDFRTFIIGAGTTAAVFALVAEGSMLATTSRSRTVPLPLGKGALIGPGGRFFGGGVLETVAFHVTGGRTAFGPWANRSAYLGFKFLSNSKTHFAWAHLKVESNLKGLISEYAYDTVPGQSIEAGQTSAIPEPGTLSLLALGAAGLAVLRKRKASAASRQGSASG